MGDEFVNPRLLKANSQIQDIVGRGWRVVFPTFRGFNPGMFYGKVSPTFDGFAVGEKRKVRNAQKKSEE